MSKNQLIPGFHATREALLHGHTVINEIWITKGKKGSRVEEITQIARGKDIPVYPKKMDEIERLLPGMNHQGIAAIVVGFSYSDIEDIAEKAIGGEGHAILIAADHITDEGNLGALIRTAVFFGAQGLIIPKDRSAGVTERVLKSSSGAYALLPVARVVNLGRALDILNKKGFWIIGAAGESPESIYQFDWNRDVVLVLGSEDRGLSHTVRKKCHQIVSIPSGEHVNSLNISVAGGVILSEIVRQRGMADEAIKQLSG